MSGRFTLDFGPGRNGHDFALASDRTVFWIGVLGLAATMLFAVWLSPQSHGKLQTQVAQAANTALAAGGHDWAEANAHGQRIDLSGAAPDAASLSAAVEDVETALGAGGVVHGGVTKVTTVNVDVVPVVSQFSWQATREDRRLTLSGLAPGREARDAIEAAARDLFGTANVTSTMTLASGAPGDVQWSATAIEAISALNQLDAGSAELTGSELVLTGSTTDETAAGEIRAQLDAIDTGATVTTFISGPAEWSARLANNSLTFSGVVSTPETRQSIAQIATDFFTAEFTDNSSVGTAGDWGDRMQVALPHFARFQSGQIDMLAGRMRISGNAAGSVLTFLREDMEAIDDGYTVIYEVREITPEITEIAGVDLDVEDEAERQASCQEGFTQIMSSNQILFESGLARIDRESGETLDKLIAVTRRCAGLQIEIEGHTDATGRASANRDLSRERAEAVRTYFLTRDIEPDRLTAVGYGEEQPIATNRTPAGRQQNRRIEFTVSSAEDAQ